MEAASRRDPARAALKVGLYIVLYVLGLVLFGTIASISGNFLVAITVTGFAAALAANIYTLRIYESRAIREIGMGWNRASGINLLLGLAGGAGGALLVLLLPLLAGVAHFESNPAAATHGGAVLFVLLMLFFGAAGEEILFRGYGFQVLLRSAGPRMAIPLVGVIFAALHAGNAHALDYKLGLVNTAGFGILFGYAFLQSRDLWFPIGLHYGWNATLPLFGVNVSGITMKVTGYALEWRAGPLWSGGEYGPEASVLTSFMFVPLVVFLWKAPVRRQHNALLDATPEGTNADGDPASSDSGNPPGAKTHL